MWLYRSVVLWVLFLQAWAKHRGKHYSFRDDFEFGAATAAYQVEGAWNVSDKSPSIWDNYLHEHAWLDNGDVTCNSYHQWETDIENLVKLGVKTYRFSISWTRLLPGGFANHISEDGKQYYNNLIDGLLKKGINPVVTLYHWDLPQTLQDLGGWANPIIAELFEDYARVAFALFGDRVKTWITVNEPFTFCLTGFNLGIHPPSIRLPGIADYICAKNALLAHAKAWRAYDNDFRSKQRGKVGITNHLLWIEAKSEDKDKEIAEILRQFNVGLFSHPIYSRKGGWPPFVEEIVATVSEIQGYPRSRLPTFTKEEITLIKGTYDFYGMNYYTGRTATVAVGEDKVSIGIGTAEVHGVLSVRATWKKAGPAWFYICYECIRKQLLWLKENYGNLDVLVTESGYGDGNGENLSDNVRIEYMTGILQQILLSINEDKVNVVGYMAWSFMDNLEWTSGFKSRFGLYHVDFEDPERQRTPRASAQFYTNVIRTRSLDMAAKLHLEKSFEIHLDKTSEIPLDKSSEIRLNDTPDPDRPDGAFLSD